MAKDTTRSSRYSRLRETQIGLDSYSKGQELPTQRVHHAGLVSIGRHPSQFARKRYDVISADTSNNIPYESLRIRRLHETAWDETVFDAYGFHPFHTGSFVASAVDNSESNTVFRSEAVFDPMFYKHYKSEHHDRESRYFEKEDDSMSAFDILKYMSGSKYYDLAFDENIYSYRTGIQEEWMLELTYRQTFNLTQEHPMSSTTGIHRKITRVDYSGEIRNSNIQELYFEDWPVLLTFNLSGSKVDADYVRAAESVLNEEIFFEENDIKINPLLDDPIGIPNAHDPAIMNQLYTFSKNEFKHSSDLVPIYFPTYSSGQSQISLSEFVPSNGLSLGNFDSSIIIDQSHSSNVGKPINLFLRDQYYPAPGLLPAAFSSLSDDVKNYTGTFDVRFEIDGAAVTRASYNSSVKSGSYTKAQIKLDADFKGQLVLWAHDISPKRQKFMYIEPYYVFRGQPSQMPLTPFNSYNKRNHINGHSGHIAEPSQRYDSIAFRGLKR